MTPEGVEHSVQLPEPRPEATEAIGKRSAAFGGNLSQSPGTDGGSKAVLLLQLLLAGTLVRSKGKSRLLGLHFYRQFRLKPPHPPLLQSVESAVCKQANLSKFLA